MRLLPIDKDPKNTRVVVAMSGGVDSSAAAAMMRELGYEVIGITLQLYDMGATPAKKGACCAGQDIHDAKNVASKIGIPHYVLNYESKFKQAVIDDFADSYLRGETPIPCVRCNQTVKFKDLLQASKELNADALVTGHYVRRVEGANGPELHKAIDHEKDQSYFLFTTTKEQLEFTHFPLGGMSKNETRALAAKYGLAVADKPDSQDICFVPGGDYAALVEKLRPGALDPGDIVDLEGKILGRHDGIINYTVGQRKGLGISSFEPLYVIKIDPDSKHVTVGPEVALLRNSFWIKDLNWLIDETNFNQLEAKVRVRSSQKETEAIITKEGNLVRVDFHAPKNAVSPGQACVMYVGDRVIGGGWIIR